MDLFKAAINGINNQGFNNFQDNMPKADKLREQLYHCTYRDDTKFVIQKAVKQVLHVYPNFETDILRFTEKNEEKRFLEIKGNLQIQARGKLLEVAYNMMLPSTFPKKAPYVRIINWNQDYLVDPNYKNLRSPTDPRSFILNERLMEAKRWNESSSIVDIIVESNKLLRQNFPFYKPSKINESNANVNQGWVNLYQNKNTEWSNSQVNNQGFNNNNNIGYNNQGFNSQGFNNNIGYNNQGSNNGMGGFGGYQNPQPPIPFNNVNVNQAIVNSQKYVGESKKIMDKLKAQHIKAVQKVQHLETIKYSLDSESLYLRNENSLMSEFLRKNESQNFTDLANLIRTKDEKSQQILNITSSIKARQDCIALLQQKFSNNEITFDELLKYVKKTEQEKFEQKALLVKCTDS